MAMDQYLLIPFLGGWTSIYQLFWCELQGYKVLTHCHVSSSFFTGFCISFHHVSQLCQVKALICAPKEEGGKNRRQRTFVLWWYEFIFHKVSLH
jgi:hypothetical protein